MRTDFKRYVKDNKINDSEFAGIENAAKNMLGLTRDKNEAAVDYLKRVYKAVGVEFPKSIQLNLSVDKKTDN